MTYSGDFSGAQASQSAQGYQQQQYYDNGPPLHTQYPPPPQPPPVSHGIQPPPLPQQYHQHQQQQQYPPPLQGSYTTYPGDSHYQAQPPPPHVSHSHSHPQAVTHVTPAQYQSVAAGAYSAAAPPLLHQAATVPAMSQHQQQYVSPPASYHQHHVAAPPPPASYANPDSVHQAPAHQHQHQHNYSAPPVSGAASTSGTCPHHHQQHQQQNQYPQDQLSYQSPPLQQDSYYSQHQQQQQQSPPPMPQSLSQDGYPQQGTENYRLDAGSPSAQNYQQQQQLLPPMHRQQSAGYPSTGPEYRHQPPVASPGPPASGRQYSNPTIPPQLGPSPLSQPPSAPLYGTQQQQSQLYPPKRQSPLDQYHHQSPPLSQSPMNSYHTPPPQPLSQAQMQRHQSLRVATTQTNDSTMHGGMRPVVSARADSRNSYIEHRQSFGTTPISAVLGSEPVIAQAPPPAGSGVVRRESSSGYSPNTYSAHGRDSFSASPGNHQGTGAAVASLVNSMGAMSVGGQSHHLPPRSATAASGGSFALPASLAASSLTIPSQFQASQATLSPQSGGQPPLAPPVRSTYSGVNNLGSIGSHSTLVGSTVPVGVGLVRNNSTQKQLAVVQSSIAGIPSPTQQQQQQRTPPTFAQTGENMAYPLWNNISATAFQAYRHQIPVQQSNLSGTKYALIIGSNYYGKEYSQTSNINWAHTLKSLLVSRYGYKEKNVVLLSDDQPDPRCHPTHHLIATHMKRMMRDVRPNDSVFFYFCGFGRLPMQLAEEHTDALSSIRRLREDFILPCDFEDHGAISSSYLHKHLVGHLPRSARLTALFNCIVNDTGLGVPYKYIHSNGRAVLTSAIAGNNLFEAGMKLGHAPLSVTGSFGDLTQRFETSLMQQQQQAAGGGGGGGGGKTDRETDEMDRIRQSSGDIIVFGWDRNYTDPRYKKYMAQTPSNMLCSYWAAAMEDTQRTKGRVTFGDVLGSLQNKTKDIAMMPFVASGRKISMDEEFSI
ncbi:Ca(2+)-dependent cysteine protease [Coemansia sp. RSA 1813]|nr:Ca(2+)-dependent cysteine protease [Coemansia sp. RSA 1813]